MPPSHCVYIINLAPSRLYNKTSRLIMLSSMHSDFIFKCKSCEYQEKVTPTSSLSTLLVQMSNINIPYCRVTCPNSDDATASNDAAAMNIPARSKAQTSISTTTRRRADDGGGDDDDADDCAET